MRCWDQEQDWNWVIQIEHSSTSHSALLVGVDLEIHVEEKVGDGSIRLKPFHGSLGSY